MTVENHSMGPEAKELGSGNEVLSRVKATCTE